MPLHNWECTKGHIFEAVADPKLKIKCQHPHCRCRAERVFLPPRKARMALAFQPVLFYENSKGEIMNPGRNVAGKQLQETMARKGYKPRTIENFRQYESLCREQNSRLREKHLQEHSDSVNNFHKSYLESLSSLNLNSLQPSVRAIAEEAIRDAMSSPDPDAMPQFSIQAFEQDNAHYRDQDTDWKKRY